VDRTSSTGVPYETLFLIRGCDWLPTRLPSSTSGALLPITFSFVKIAPSDAIP
jgi:hypothetical protein